MSIKPNEPTAEEVERMHDRNAANWRNFIKAVASAEIDYISEDEIGRRMAIRLNTGQTFEITNIRYGVKVHSLAVAFEYIFNRLEAFPMAMEVGEI